MLYVYINWLCGKLGIKQKELGQGQMLKHLVYIHQGSISARQEHVALFLDVDNVKTSLPSVCSFLELLVVHA